MSSPFPARAIDKKHLCVFTKRFIPAWWMERYPDFEVLLRTFLEFLEQDEQQYDNITNYDKYFDIDKIVMLKNSSDPVKQDLGNKLIDQVYKQYLGDSNTRYLSTLMDEVLYIKNQKNILKYKGTKYSFMFFFLLILGGFFRIYTILGSVKKHDGIFQYNGLIYYGNGENWVEPFIYLVKSEFPPEKYKLVLNVLNPAGMRAITYLYNSSNYTLNDTVENAWNYNNVYMMFYLDSTFVAMVKCSVFPYIQVTENDTFDLELENQTFWIKYPTLGTGMNHLYYEANFNTSIFTGEFNSVHLVKDPIYDGNPADQFCYTILPDSFTDFTGAIDNTSHTGTPNLTVVDDESIGVMLTCNF
jgi:hypothetical protein